MGGMPFSTFTFSSRAVSGSALRGNGSIATLETTWSRWFWTTSRMVPARVVEGAAALDAEVLRHRDLDALDVVAVPDRLEEGVGEAEEDEVLDGALPQVVVDAEDVLLRERLVQRGVQRLRASTRSFPNGFSMTSRAPSTQPAPGELLGDEPEQPLRDGEVVHRPVGVAQRPLQRVEGGGILVVAVDVAQELEHAREGRRVEAAVPLDALLRARLQLLEVPARLATPTIGTSRTPRRTIACSAGKIFL